MARNKWMEDMFILPKPETKKETKKVEVSWYMCERKLGSKTCGKKFRSESGIDYHQDFKCINPRIRKV
jgi:hypothetical protein